MALRLAMAIGTLLCFGAVSCLFWLAASPAAAQLSESWPDPVANHTIPYLTGGLTHGPMLGRPTATSMRVWIRTAKPAEFHVVCNRQLPLSEKTRGIAGQTSAKADNTGWVDLTGLKPNTRYYYGIVIGGRLVDTRMDLDEPWPNFRTFPDADTCRDEKYNPRGLHNVCFSIGTGGWYDSAGRKVKVKWTAGFPTIHYTRLHSTLYAVVQVNNVLRSGRADGPGYHYVAYDAPTVVVRFHDGHTGNLLYAEAVSPLDIDKR